MCYRALINFKKINMTKITRHDIDHNVGQIVLFLIGISFFLTYKLFYSLNVEYILVLSCCLISILTVYRTAHILRNGLSSKGSYEITFFDNVVTRFALMVILGGLSFYLVLYKGFYGLYELTSEFSWFLLFFRITIVFIGTRLVYSLDKLQTGFKMITSGNYTVEKI